MAKSTSEVQQIDLTKLNLQQLQQLKNEFESVSVWCNQLDGIHVWLITPTLSAASVHMQQLFWFIFYIFSFCIDAQELNVFQESLQTLKMAKTKFDGSKDALEQISGDWKNKEILVPLTGSMYVKGVINNIDKFIIDVGTGYYVEKV